MKINIVIIALIVLVLIAPIVVVRTAYAKNTKTATLVFDRAIDEEDLVPNKFRTNSGLNVSASGQFSAAQLNNILSDIGVSRDKIWAIDLRQESHGFINGIPISWYAAKNQANLNLNPDQIRAREEKLLHTLSVQPEIVVYTVKKLNDGEVAADRPVKILPQCIETEQQLVTSLGARYKRLFVLDHHHPDDHEVDVFVDFVKNQIQPGDWLHFHCRGGKGRSSTFIAMYDIIHNGQKCSFEEIMQRQIEMGNSRLDKPNPKPEKQWKAGASEQRYKFLQKFYAYVSDSNGYAQRSWSSWLQADAAK